MHKRTLSSFLANRTYEPHFIIVHYSENFEILISSPCVILMLCKYLWVEKNVIMHIFFSGCCK